RGETAERERRGDAPARRLLERDEERGHRRGEQDRSGEVEGAAGAQLVVGGQGAPADREAGEAEDEAEREDAAPAHGIGDETGERRAGRESGIGEDAHRAERAAALARAEGADEDRDRVGEEHRGAECLQRAGGDERRDGRREAAERGAGDEDRETGEEDAALAAEIAETAEREHEARGDELVDREGEADRD